MVPVHGGDIFDLGGIQLEVYETPGHSPGSICLLDRKDRFLFSGDTIVAHTWMQLPECPPMATLLQSLNRLQTLRGEFDHIFFGHSTEGPENASFSELQRNAVWEVCEGKNENDEPYEWFGGVCKAHPYGEMNQWKIVYNG